MSQNSTKLINDAHNNNNNNNQQKILANAVRLIKSRDATRVQVPSNTFLLGGQDDLMPDIPEESEHEQSNEITEQTCPDFNAHGRCLGYHPLRDRTLDQTQLLPRTDTVFNQTLNSTVVSVGHQQWDKLLHNLPTWSVQSFLNTCPQSCRPRGTSLHKNPVGDKLAALINESMREKPAAREQPSTSTIFNSSLAANPPHQANTSIPSLFDQPPMPPVSKHSARVRIQHPKTTTLMEHSFISTPPDNSRLGFPVIPTMQTNTLESWQVMRIEDSDQLCVRGKHMRSRKVWRSTAIRRRLSPRSLQTTSGTLYQIVGPCVNHDNVMPPFIEDKFSAGFPVDWEDLAKRWAREEEQEVPPSQSQTTSKRGAARKDHLVQPPKSKANSTKAQTSSQIFPESGSDDDHPRTASAATRRDAAIKAEPLTKPKAGKREIVSKKKATIPKTKKTVVGQKPKTKPRARRLKSSSDESDTDEPRVPDQNCSVIIKKLEDKEFTHQPSKEKASSDTMKWLQDWRPVTQGDMKMLAGRLIMKNGTTLEEGHVSSTISKRLSATLIVTDNGTQYNLVGPPCWLTSENGTPIARVGQTPTQPEIKKKFSKGFPFNWVAALHIWQDTSKKGSPKVAKKRVITGKGQNRKKKSVGEMTDDDDNADISAIKITVSSRGRKIIQPVKYWENCSTLTIGKNFIYRQNMKTQKVISVDGSPNPVIPAKKRKEAEQPKPSKPKSQAKRPRLILKKNVKETKPLKEISPKKASQVEGPSSVVNGELEGPEKPVPAAEPPDDDDEEEEDILGILTRAPKTLKHRHKRDTLIKNLQQKNTRLEADLFASSCSGISSDELSDNSFWDADSVSSKVTSDDDRMKFNYTPPGARMRKFVPTAAPTKQDFSMSYEGQKRDRRTMGFVQRQMSKPKTLMTKKQRDEQKAVAGTSAKLMQYKSTDPQEAKLANAMYLQLTSGEKMGPEAADFFKRVPASSNANDSDTSVEKYYTDDEDAEMFL